MERESVGKKDGEMGGQWQFIVIGVSRSAKSVFISYCSMSTSTHLKGVKIILKRSENENDHMMTLQKSCSCLLSVAEKKISLCQYSF